MKALTLMQPWATLLAHGLKKLETRRWATAHRGVLAVHAAKNFPDVAKKLCVDNPAFAKALETIGTTVDQLPLGVVLGTVEVYDVKPAGEVLTGSRIADTSEYAFGDFSTGRFVWFCRDAKPLLLPFPHRGNLGLWNVADVLYQRALSE